MSSQSDAMCFFSCVQAISCMLSLDDLFTCHALRCTLCLTAAFSVTMLLLRFTGNASCFGLAYTCLHFILTHCKSELLIRLTITDKTCLELGICNRDGEGRGFYQCYYLYRSIFFKMRRKSFIINSCYKMTRGINWLQNKVHKRAKKKQNKKDWCTSKNLFVFFSQLPDEKIL